MMVDSENLRRRRKREEGEEPVSKYEIQTDCGEQAD